MDAQESGAGVLQSRNLPFPRQKSAEFIQNSSGNTEVDGGSFFFHHQFAGLFWQSNLSPIPHLCCTWGSFPTQLLVLLFPAGAPGSQFPVTHRFPSFPTPHSGDPGTT